MLQRFQNWMNERKNRSILGLDINSNVIKGVEVDTTNPSRIVKNIINLPFFESSENKDSLKNPEKAGNLLRETLRNQNIKTNEVAIAVSRSSVVIKEIQVDRRLSLAEIESRVWVEAHHHFPELVGDVYLDFVITNPDQKDSKTSDVMLIACRKDQLKPYFEILNHAGLTPQLVDVTSFALERSLQHMIKDMTLPDTVGLINLDFGTNHFIVLHKGLFYYGLDQSFDGLKFISSVNQYLKQPVEGATADQQNLHGTLLDPNYLNLLKENLIAQLRHTMQFFYSSRPNISIKRLFISGDCASIPHLPLFLQQELGIEAQLANVFEKIDIDPALQNQDLKNSANLMLSMGLALSKF